jgi:hypothetical protein
MAQSFRSSSRSEKRVRKGETAEIMVDQDETIRLGCWIWLKVLPRGSELSRVQNMLEVLGYLRLDLWGAVLRCDTYCFAGNAPSC